MASQIALTTEVREDTKMVMKYQDDWGAYLTPAPLSIAFMGELVFISLSQDDFPINNPPTGGFKYIKHPDSFSASLMQVCNSGWHAFNEAHKNMDQIRLHTANIPDYMNKAVKYLFSDNDKIVGKLVPLQLDNIEKISETCVTLAKSVEEKFMEVINLIEELLVAACGAEGLYGAEKVRVEKELEASKLKKKQAEEMKERFNEMLKESSEEMEKAQEEFTKSTNSLPSGEDMLKMDAEEGHTSLFFLRLFRSGYKSASERENENARFRIEERSKQLNKAREAREKHLEEMKQSEKKLSDILVDMSKCSLQEINFNKTIEMLGKGLSAMTQVKAQWSNLVQFFQMISHIVSISFKGKVIKDFVDTAKLTQGFNFDEKLLLKDDMYQEAVQASSLAGLVNMLSGTYIEVSNKFLLDRVNNLGELMALDKDDKEQLEEKRKEMRDSCEEAKQGILELVKKNKTEFDEKTKARMLQIKGGLKAALPATLQ